MGDRLDREVALSRNDKVIETEAARQAHYIKWTQIMGILDPCGNALGYQRIAGIYLIFAKNGINCTDKRGLRSATLAGYGDAINALFTLRGFPPPVVISDPNNASGIVIKNLKNEEDIANQRSPLDSEIFAEIQRSSSTSKSEDSEVSLMMDLTCINRVTGSRMSEYSQTKGKVIDYHTFPSGAKVIKAFTADDFLFIDKRGHKVKLPHQPSTDQIIALENRIVKVTITWRFQKNRQNNEKRTFSAENPSNKIICPVRAAMRIILRARRLNQPDHLPVAVYKHKDSFAYITGSRVGVLLRQAVRLAHPDISKEDLKKFSAHSFRVWACVLLDEAGKSPDFIKKRLRWLGDSYRNYLRDTCAIQDQHREALASASLELMRLIEADPEDVIELSTNNAVGEYSDNEE